MPAKIELIASSLSRIHLKAHFTVLIVNVEAVKNAIIDKY